MKHFFTFLSILALLLIVNVGWGQQSINLLDVAVNQNFDEMGTSGTATLPTGFKIGTDWSSGSTATTLAYGSTGTGAVTGTSTGGAINWANGVTGSSTERALGFLTTGSYTSPKSIIYAFTNNTGNTITSIDLAWNYEKYRSGSRAFDWTFFHGSASTATTAETSGDQSYTADANNTTVSNPPLSVSKSFLITGLSIANGSTYYLRWTYTGSGGSTNAQGLAIDDFSITLKATSGTPDIAISSAHPSSTNVTQGSTNNILASFQLHVTTASATLNGISVTTAGTYTASDIATNGFKFWINSSNNLSGATQLGSAQAAVGSGNAVSVSGLSQSISSGTTRYILLTADVSSSAATSNTISVTSTSFSNITFSSGNKTGDDPVLASNTMTIIACTPTNVTGLGLTPGNTQITVSWTNPACYDELMIVAKPTSSIGASPSGDGSAYTANLTFGSGTSFDGTGHVVYKGSTSPQTITGLTNGTTYYVKVFTRKGSVWSAGEESSATPNVNTYTWVDSHTRTAWARVENWSGGASGTFPGNDANTSSSSGNSSDICVIGSVGFSGSEIGLNFGTSANTGVGSNSAFNGSLSLGALHFNGINKAISLGKNDGSSLGSLLTLTGGTIVAVPNTIISYNSVYNATIAGLAGGSSESMSLAFGNSTNNIVTIDNSSDLIISCAITSASGPVTISGSGSGLVEFSGQNTYTTTTTVTGSTLRLNRTGGTTIPATNNVTVSGGTLRISSNQTLNNLTIEEGGNLIVDGVATLTINGALTLNESVTIAGNLVIGSSGEAVIASEKVLTNSGTLTIKSDATGTGSLIVNGSIDGAGSFSLERHLPQAAQTWHFLSAPVNGSIATNGLNPGGTEDFFAWSESSPGTWVNYANTTVVPTFETVNGSNFVKGRGYLVAYIGVNPTKTFTSGTITTGNVDIQLKRSESKSWTYEPGWNLLGNPYTSGIDWNLADRAKFEDNYAYVYDPNKGGGAGFVNINGGNANAYIAANQGFFVRAKDGENNQNFTFTNAMQVPNGSFMKQQTIEDQLVLKLSFGDYYDKSYIQLKPEASAARDKNDALKLFSYDANVPQLFSKSSNVIMLAVNAIPEVNENTQVTIGIRAPVQGTYSLEVIESASIFQNNNLFLKDQKLNIMHNLTHQAVYNFTAAQGDEPNRFLLHFGVVGITEKPSKPALHAYVAAGQLHLLNLHGTAQLDIFDLSGRLLQQHKVVANGKQSVPLALPAGVYVVLATGETNSEAVKVIVQ